VTTITHIHEPNDISAQRRHGSEKCVAGFICEAHPENGRMTTVRAGDATRCTRLRAGPLGFEDHPRSYSSSSGREQQSFAISLMPVQ
jgi:hypothetical protein